MKRWYVGVVLLGLLAALVSGVRWQVAQAAPVGETTALVYLPSVVTSCEDYLDDFSNPASGWFTGESAQAYTWYTAAGQYEISTKGAGYIISRLAPMAARVDYVVEADMRFPGPASNGLLGLVFGADSEFTRYYLFALYPDLQGYRLLRLNSDDSVTPLTGVVSDVAVLAGTAVNRAQVVRQGNDIHLYANNSYLTTVTDGSFIGESYAGVGVSANPANPQLAAHFDYFRVHSCFPAVGAAREVGTPVQLPGVGDWSLMLRREG
jgi:hypothetical protein